MKQLTERYNLPEVKRDEEAKIAEIKKRIANRATCFITPS
jgi:hypothetical protein